MITLLLLVRATYTYGGVLHAHPIRGESHINATTPEKLQQHPLLFTTNLTDRTFFVWRLNSARPPHPGHSTILLRSEMPSGMCAKFRTVAASSNRVHMPWSLYCCLFAPHICMVLFFTHIPFVVNHTLTQHHRRGCNTFNQNYVSILSWRVLSEIRGSNLNYERSHAFTCQC